MMANATRDPYWIAKVAAEIDRNPDLHTILDDTCSRCHAPMANDIARKENTSFSIIDADALLSNEHELFDHAMEGVSCTLCHQMEDTGVMGTPEGVSGNFSVAEYTSLADRPAFGSYTDPDGSFMQATAQFNPMYGPHLSTAESCATCHDLRTPSVDLSGNLIDGSTTTFFPEQMVFSEWQHSDYRTDGSREQTCQECHMPTVPGGVKLATRGGGPVRQGFSRHTFLGANTVMQQLLMEFSETLGVTTAATQFAQSIARNRAFLNTAATVKLVSGRLEGQELSVDVRITNQVGHKLPSGYPSRRVYVHFVVKDAADNVVFESGSLQSDGSVAGLATDADNSLYENHYDIITQSDQVQVYEAIMGDAGSSVTHTLMRASHYLKDNRLLPSGFNKSSAPDDIKVAGLAQADTNFEAGGDSITYRVPVAGAGEYTVRAELIYQPLAYGHLQDLFESSHLPEVERFKSLFDATLLKAESIASDTVTVH